MVFSIRSGVYSYTCFNVMFVHVCHIKCRLSLMMAILHLMLQYEDVDCQHCAMRETTSL